MKKRSGLRQGKMKSRTHMRPCFMAYTLNNTQPVICTLVADQPYFYMDEVAETAEEDILGLETLDTFERELKDIQQKIGAIEKISKDFEQTPDRRLDLFVSDGFTLTQRKEEESASSETILETLYETLYHSRTAKELLAFAASKNVSLTISAQESEARYDAQAQKIWINPSLGLEETVLLTVRELRRHWQHRQGAMIHPLSFHPDHAILINRAQNADLTVAMIRSAWEFQLAGQKDIWAYVENSHFSDLAHALAKEAFVDFRSLNTGKASMAVFESWFLSERSRYHDKQLISQMLADHNGYVFNNVEASKAITLDLMAALGAQPFGKNYLMGNVRALLDDPLYTEVRDRSNANFLWFVKFERTFHETEQVLQQEGGFPGADALFAPFSRKTDQDHDKTAQLIELHPNYSSEGSSDSQGHRGNVIHVQFGKGARA